MTISDTQHSFFEDISNLIRTEQARQNGLFIEIDINSYINKIYSHAEIIPHYINGNLAGLIAFYCNDYSSKTLFITSVVIAPEYRGLQLATNLINMAKLIAKSRGFTYCKLQVHSKNTSAINLYKKNGFLFIDENKERPYMIYNI